MINDEELIKNVEERIAYDNSQKDYAKRKRGMRRLMTTLCSLVLLCGITVGVDAATDGINPMNANIPARNATTPPNEIVFALVSLLAIGQTITIPSAVGTAPTVLIIDETVLPPVIAWE